MQSDPITEDIRNIRRELAAQFGNDVARIFADLRQRETSDGRTYVTLPSRPVLISAGMDRRSSSSDQEHQL